MNRLFLSYCSLAILFFFFSCQQVLEKTLPEISSEFESVLEAHGDWKKWYNAKAESYAMIHETLLIEERTSVNLATRKIRISNPEFEIGFDGKQTWVSPNREAYKGSSVKFYHNLYFYFFNIPYVFTDPGVMVNKVEDKAVNGKKYNTLEASFAPSTGSSPKDQYFMLINPETNRLEYLLYSVTYFGNENPSLTALKYDDYRASDGVDFPRYLTGYVFENDSTKKLLYQVSFADALLLNEEFDAKTFEKPTIGVFAD